MHFTSGHALLALVSLGLLSSSADAFYNTFAGLVADVTTNPLGVIAVLLIKKLILEKLIFLGKRSVEDELAAAPGISPHDPQTLNSSDYEQLAARFDLNGCLAKLVCEIVAEQNATTKFEKAIIQYFGQDPNPDITDDITKSTSIFHYAAFMGKLAKGPENCTLVFPNCKKSEEDVRKVAEVVFELDI